MKRIFAIVIVALTIAGCGGKKDAKMQDASQAQQPEKVEVKALTKQSIAKELELSTTLEGYETISSIYMCRWAAAWRKAACWYAWTRRS